MAEITTKDKDNRINIIASEFVDSVAAPVAYAYRLSEALNEMRNSFLDNVTTFEGPHFEEVAKTMVGPMNRVHRYSRHEAIERLRNTTAHFIIKRGAPWWKCWKWKYHSAAKRKQQRVETVRLMRDEARNSTLALAREYVNGIAKSYDGPFGWEGFRRAYESSYYGSWVPAEIGLNHLKIGVQVDAPKQLVRLVTGSTMTHHDELSFLFRIKETLDAAVVWPDKAVLDIPVSFLVSTQSLVTLVNAPLLKTMKELYTISTVKLNLPLPIPEIVQGTLGISST